MSGSYRLSYGVHSMDDLGEAEISTLEARLAELSEANIALRQENAALEGYLTRSVAVRSLLAIAVDCYKE